MTAQSWLMYLILVFIATATPGPAVLFIMTKSTIYGWKKASFAALGNIMGLLCLGIIAVTGLESILRSSEIMFGIMKYIGAIYLVYLGVKLILQKNVDIDAISEKVVLNNISAQKVFFQAFAVAVSNPKAIVFLTALFPQFVNINEALIPQFSALIGTLMFFSFTFLMFYSLVAHQAKTWIAKSNRITVLNRTSGSIFIGFGVLLATSSNK